MGDSAFFESPGLQQQVGTGSGKQELAGVLDVNAGPATTVGTGEQTLKTSTLKANSLSEDGKTLKIRAWGTTAGVAGTRTMSLKYAGAVIAQLVVAGGVAAASWYLEAVASKAGLNLEAIGIALAPGNIANALQSLPMALSLADQSIIVTGNCANAADAIVARGLVVEFLN